tara:strand:- start:195 stop:305 length:111 start_codon:yes stop_codon:yes gene_type:complete
MKKRMSAKAENIQAAIMSLIILAVYGWGLNVFLESL